MSKTKTSGKRQLLCLDIDILKEAANRNTSSGLRSKHKLEILERDEFKCTECGSLDNLTIAHIIPPKRKKGRNAGSYKLDDCKTMCEKCHILYDDKLDNELGNELQETEESTQWWK